MSHYKIGELDCMLCTLVAMKCMGFIFENVTLIQLASILLMAELRRMEVTKLPSDVQKFLFPVFLPNLVEEFENVGLKHSSFSIHVKSCFCVVQLRTKMHITLWICYILLPGCE